MFRKSIAAILLGAVATVAGAGITADLALYSCGVLSDGVTRYYSYDLQVTVTGDDAWTVAGAMTVGEPWCTVTGGTFYQDPDNDGNPPDPALFQSYPDSEFTSFYTTHTLWPNTDSLSPPPGFAYGPNDTDTELEADWYWMIDGRYYPGTFTIARFTVLPTEDDCVCVVDMQIGSLNVPPFQFSPWWWPRCEGDVDGDCEVNLNDLAELLSAYGTCPGDPGWNPGADLAGDSCIDLEDLAELLSHYGTDCH
jgi:hypothetical protein